MYFDDMLMWLIIGLTLLVGGLLIVYLSRRTLTPSERANAGISSSPAAATKGKSSTRNMQVWYIAGWVIAAIGSVVLLYQVIFPVLALGVFSVFVEVLR